MPNYAELDDYNVKASDLMRLLDTRSLITTVTIAWSGSREQTFDIRVGFIDGTELGITATRRTQ